MTITLTEGPLTAHAVLFPAGDTQHTTDLGDGMTATVTSIDWGALAPATGAAVRRDFDDAVAAVLDVSLASVLVAGWKKHGELKAAAERTLANPDASETVQLAHHQISHQAKPYVDVLLGGEPVGRVALGLGIEVDITVLGGTVRAGRLVALTSGDAAVTVSLAVGDHRVAHSEPHTIALALELSLGEGIKLADPQPPIAGPGRA